MCLRSVGILVRGHFDNVQAVGGWCCFHLYLYSPPPASLPSRTFLPATCLPTLPSLQANNQAFQAGAGIQAVTFAVFDI